MKVSRTLWRMCLVAAMVALSFLASPVSAQNTPIGGAWSGEVQENSTLAPNYPSMVQVTTSDIQGLATLHGHPQSTTKQVNSSCTNFMTPQGQIIVTYWLRYKVKAMGDYPPLLQRKVMTFYRQTCVT